MSDLHRLIGTPPPRTSFPALDDVHAFTHKLSERFPDLVQVRTLGTSANGEPIHEVVIGNGPCHAIIVGNVHPNEPIGLLTIQHLTTRLTENPELARELGFTWHFIPCIDPDGTRLNEGWYRGPITRSNVGRHFYRTPKRKQAEWTFPVEWRGRTVGVPVRETRILMSLIDQTEPALYVSLHNADFGGGYYYVTGGDDEYWAGLQRLLHDAGIPVEGGVADAPGARTLAKGVFEQAPVGEYFDLAAAANPDAADGFEGGAPSDYAAKYGTASLVCELPLWFDPRGSDESPSTWRFADLLAATAARYRQDSELMLGVIERLDGELPAADPRYEALVQALPGNGVILDARAQAALSVDRLATKAEEFMELYGLTEMMRLRNGGMLTQLLDEAAAMSSSARLEKEQEAFRSTFDAWCAEVETQRPGQAVALDRLVWAQTGAVLLAATRVRDGKPV